MQRQEAGELRRGNSARVCLTSEQTLNTRVLSEGNLVLQQALALLQLRVQKSLTWESPMGPWLGLSVFTVVGPHSIPGQGTRIPQAVQHGQKGEKNLKKSLIHSSQLPKVMPPTSKKRKV